MSLVKKFVSLAYIGKYQVKRSAMELIATIYATVRLSLDKY